MLGDISKPMSENMLGNMSGHLFIVFSEMKTYWNFMS